MVVCGVVPVDPRVPVLLAGAFTGTTVCTMCDDGKTVLLFLCLLSLISLTGTHFFIHVFLPQKHGVFLGRTYHTRCMNYKINYWQHILAGSIT